MQLPCSGGSRATRGSGSLVYQLHIMSPPRPRGSGDAYPSGSGIRRKMTTSTKRHEASRPSDLERAAAAVSKLDKEFQKIAFEGELGRAADGRKRVDR